MAQITIDISTPPDRAVRFHCLSGDVLAVRAGGALRWLAPGGLLDSAERAGRRRLSFAYRDGEAPDESVVLDLGTFRSDLVDRVAQSARRLSVTAVDRRWRPTIACVGALPRPSGGETAEHIVMPLDGPVVAAARRIVHPSYIVDRLMMRQRAIASADMETMLFGDARSERRYA
jgi:hypothetical protein